MFTAGPARCALDRLLADRDWHQWWQIEQTAGVFVDPRIAGRRFIRGHDDARRRRGMPAMGLDLMRADPARALRIGTRHVLRDVLKGMRAERRGRGARAEYRLPAAGDSSAPKGGREG